MKNNKRILIVDDDADILMAYHRNLRKYFTIKTTTDPYEAIDLIKDSEPFSVILTDYNMPELNGLELLNHIKKIDSEVVKILITGFADLEIAIKALNQNNVFRFITKPIAMDDLIEVLNIGFNQFELVTSEKNLLENTLKGSIKLLIELMSLSNKSVFNKSMRLRKYSKIIADGLNLKRTWDIEISALLSQIGCLSIPIDIIEKKYAGMVLTNDELNLYNSHPEISKNLLKYIPKLEEIAEAILHQNSDFHSYNSLYDNYRKNDLPLLSRILKIIIDFDDFKTHGLDDNTSLSEMKSNSFKYDIEILKVLEKAITGNFISKEIRSIPFKNIRIGMTLADDIRDSKGNILLKNGYEITDVILIQLINASKVRSINEPLKVFV